jgi:hypothetical protein
MARKSHTYLFRCLSLVIQPAMTAVEEYSSQKMNQIGAGLEAFEGGSLLSRRANV